MRDRHSIEIDTDGTDADPANVVIPEATASLLRSLGWISPKEQEQ